MPIDLVPTMVRLFCPWLGKHPDAVRLYNEQVMMAAELADAQNHA